MTTFTIRAERIPEQVIPGRRLGRHIWHDSRSRAYAVPELPFGALQPVAWERHIPILDQGNVGSCTGNAMDGALGTGPLWDALPAGHPVLDEAEALRIYSAAEVIDGNGTYPPVDDGSYGLSVAKAAKNAGFISGYQHAFSRAAMLTALQSGPVIIGISWYTSMDSPDSRGLVTVGGSVRGGHELECRELDMVDGLVWLDNSWSAGWGKAGRCCLSFTSLDRLLGEGGDVTVPLPLSVPAPVPVPVDDADHALWTVAGPWAAQPRTRPDLVVLKGALDGWAATKGYGP
jgi:hypothetical protein